MSNTSKNKILSPHDTSIRHGYDYYFGMSVNYIKAYLRGYRDIYFIETFKDKYLKDYIYKSNIFETHHHTKNNKIETIKLFPVKNLLTTFLKEELLKIEDKERIRFYKKYIKYQLKKIDEQNNKFQQKYQEIENHPLNRLVLRMTDLNNGLNVFDEYRDSLDSNIGRKTFNKLSTYNSSPFIDRLVNGKRFVLIQSNVISPLFVNLDKLVSIDLNENDVFSYLPKYAFSITNEKIKLRNYDYANLDPNYLKLTKQWSDFNCDFELGVQKNISRARNKLIVISLSSFNEDDIFKRNKDNNNNNNKRNNPDIFITFSSYFLKKIKNKVKQRIYHLNQTHKLKTSFALPLEDKYELLNRNKNKVCSLTIMINKNLYLTDLLTPSIKDDLYIIKKYLDDIFVFLLNVNY